ncbi:MAG: sugar transferase [Candidatus Pacebacteria bacterium]|nr:sugar transferase [Candidatus Paceibacterota bacterium]PIR63802.1 MAG: multidrug MFS transporter [Candidatus Pacebacteria bacterium CG10_big_fil_rev_8_21_14_0_10_40_26]PIZ78589.1 MAG: multidrug MFS transporter [Candidatus Pacebacteria bacterium CG_4_10_14_0_2_um_filter_40_20]PJA69440.1 MAG: multidrug MFS transporter [Candidatus Pacebacteria bacterium CG_4_9_14_3_um_filter_40_12]PJC41457.1 MAG: multidrug MFS transporter [Candidatus Pacebacteria bacterium CG_4_9_14_0_2_um_filter_40_15]
MSYQQQKRILDILVSIGLMVMFLPVWIIVPILIYLDSGFPIFFKHKRVGIGGNDFYIYKFRSMIPNADEILHKKNKKLLKKFKAGDWKIENDPRITKLGKVLRSLTIDEFPQLLNVITGDMSMVGPRAYVKKELDEQTEKYPETKEFKSLILSVKPGITGPWQTSGRNEVPFTVRAKMDAEYAQRQSIIEDIGILFKTPKAMISKW